MVKGVKRNNFFFIFGFAWHTEGKMGEEEDGRLQLTCGASAGFIHDRVSPEGRTATASEASARIILLKFVKFGFRLKLL